MKKLTLVFIFHLLLVSTSLAQPTIEWQRAFGGTGTDWGPNNIRQTSDGGYILAGISESNDGDVTNNHGMSDCWVVKFDADGNLQWQRSYGGSDIEQAITIQETIDKGYVIGGNTQSNNGDVSGNHGYADAWILKIDQRGLMLWQKCYGGSNAEDAFYIEQTNDGGYVFTGETSSVNGNVSGNHGNRDFWVVKIDSLGNLQWQKCLGGTNDDMSYCVHQTFNGDYIIGGYTSSTDGDITLNHGSNDSWLVRLDGSGNLIWQKCYGGTSWEEINGIIQTSDGGFITIGTVLSNDGDVSGNHGGTDYWVFKTDSLGNLVWQNCYGGSSSEHGYCLYQTNDNGFILTGGSYSNDGDVTLNYGAQDYWVVKLDSSGNISWEKNLGGSGSDYSWPILQNSNNDFIVAGFTNSNDFDVTNNHSGGNDIWMVKLTGNFNEISGKTFIDLNSNQIQDAVESPINFHYISEINSNRFCFSQPNGDFKLSVLDSGNFNVVPVPLPYYNAVPVSHTGTFSSINQKDSLNDFAFQPTGVYNDLCMDLTPLGPFRSGFNGTYRLDYQNVGTTTLTGTVIFYPDSNLSYVSSTLNPTFISVDSIVWNVGSLTPFQTGNINVTFLINTGLTIGSLIYSTAHINPVAGDANPQCNYAAWEVYTTGSADPNAIFVDKEILETTQFPNPPWLDYIIYFQNTGNDTAFTVKIMDDIPAELDMSTLSFVSSSHPVTMRNIPVSRYMEFKFDNILLPDSNVNEPSSHGFIRYRIKPVTSLVLGDSIKNSAYIYFDLNKPVLTNVATTAIVLPTGIPSYTKTQEQKIFIFPNPASGELTVKWLVPVRKNENSFLKIFDMMGRNVYQKQIASEKTQQIKLDVSQFPSGLYVLQLDNSRKIFVRE